ncbi:hypothetical protein CCACVL1_00689, partial [Corchorus capsularis]
AYALSASGYNRRDLIDRMEEYIDK